MDPKAVRALLEEVRSGHTSVEEATRTLRHLPFADLGYATIDHHRALRQGHPEVIFGEGKTVEQIIGIARAIDERAQAVLVTRVDEAKAARIREVIPEISYDPMARTLILRRTPAERRGHGTICVVSAGTSDMPVAEECARTAEFFGNAVVRIYDVGVAGLQRVLAKREALGEARVIVVVAGMEGALASVIAGLVTKPVIAVPTSVGYGAAFGGIAALLGMMTSCASGVTVVNIDNGFGAGFAASQINQMDGV